MSPQTPDHINTISRAAYAVMIEVGGEVGGDVLDTCINQVERGVAVEVLMDVRNRVLMEGDPFLLHRCLKLINKGGAVFLMAHNDVHAVERFQCIVDFEEVYDFSGGRCVVYTAEKRLGDLQKAVREFNVLKAAGTPYLVEPGDLRVDFTVSEDVVMKGDKVELRWAADLADKVIIQGVGEVGPYGSKRLQVDRSTIIRMGAYHVRQSQIRAVKVWVSEEVKIVYDIGFMSPGSHTYSSLVQVDNYPHIYGVAKGNVMRLTWQVLDAHAVKVLPFNIHKHMGEYIFTSADSLNIEIQADIQGRVVSRKIKLLIFPIPVFKDKLVSVLKHIRPRHQFTTSLQREGLDKIRETQLRVGIHLQAMLLKESKRYIMMYEDLSGQYFDRQSKRFNLKRVNAFLFGFLKRMYSRRAGIVDVVQSIQDYYHHPKHKS